jgi:HEAT repeat protein
MSRGLAHDLRGGDEATAAAAAARLGELGEIGREPLEAALAAGATLVRKAAANALLRIGDPRSLPALTAAARAGLPEAELAAAGILAKLPAEEIAKRIAEGDVLLRRLAVSAAATAGGPAVQKALLAGARDPEREVRLAAALALGKLGGEGAVAALAALLEDEADAVREAAADSLGKLAEPAARPALLKLTRYGNRRVRRAVMRALARLPGPPPREAVVTLLESLGDDDPSVREHALLALAKADRRDRRVVPVVRLQLKDSAAAVRRASVIAVGALGGSAVISSLKEALTDEAPEVRLAAVEALEQIGGDDAATTLARHAGAEKDPKVAARAREASERLKQK